MNKLRTLDSLIINKEIDEVALSGSLQCFCGCKEFNIYHSGKQTKQLIIKNNVKEFKINLYFNYNKEKYKTN